MNRKQIEKEAMKRFGMCQYVDTITPSPKADGRRFIRTYWLKNYAKPVAKLYIYESTGKVYLKDYLKNETLSNDSAHASWSSYDSVRHSTRDFVTSWWQKNKSWYTQTPLFN